MRRGEQHRDRTGHVGRVAQERVAVEEHVAQHLGQHVRRRRRVEPQRTHVVALDHPERLAKRHPARRRRRRPQHLPAAIRAAQRIGLRHPVAREIGRGDAAAARLRRRRHRRRHRPAIEPVRPVRRHQRQGAREVRLHQPIARLQRRAVRAQEHRRQRRIGPEAGVAHCQDVDIRLRQHEPVAGQRDRRRHHLPARQPPVLAQHGVEPEHAARHRRRTPAEQAGAADRPALRVEVHRRGGRRRRRLAEIDEALAPVGHVQHDEAAAAQVAAARIDHRLGVAHGHRGIHRVAALTQDARAHLGGKMLGGDHHAAIRLDRRRHGSPCSRPIHSQGDRQPRRPGQPPPARNACPLAPSRAASDQRPPGRIAPGPRGRPGQPSRARWCRGAQPAGPAGLRSARPSVPWPGGTRSCASPRSGSPPRSPGCGPCAPPNGGPAGRPGRSAAACPPS